MGFSIGMPVGICWYASSEYRPLVVSHGFQMNFKLLLSSSCLPFTILSSPLPLNMMLHALLPIHIALPCNRNLTPLLPLISAPTLAPLVQKGWMLSSLPASLHTLMLHLFHYFDFFFACLPRYTINMFPT